ncbi:hypothetical protein ACCO45_008245 [Purpureocillium lilacinum]|uniref:Uncharacterized protein n=1 Tax=Purpureocillium lilacinum TaxID=33203 RepID=A0ACC4DMT2_PURLI
MHLREATSAPEVGTLEATRAPAQQRTPALRALSARSSSALSARRCAALEPPAPDRLTSERADLEQLDRGSILPAQGEAHPLQRLSQAFLKRHHLLRYPFLPQN